MRRQTDQHAGVLTATMTNGSNSALFWKGAQHAKESGDDRYKRHNDRGYA